MCEDGRRTSANSAMDHRERKLRLHEKRMEILLRECPDLDGTIQFSPRSTYPMLDNIVAMRAVMKREGLGSGRLLLCGCSGPLD